MMKSLTTIPVIIPAYQPDEKLFGLLSGLRAAGFRNLVVVDDGSGPEYRDIFTRAVSEYQCTLLNHAINLGKGRALKTAMNYCLSTFPDAAGCITADADGQHSPAGILACARALDENREALILGCRRFGTEGVPVRSNLGNRLTRQVMKYMAGISVSDTQTGLRGIPGAFMKILLKIKGERYEFETNMLMETRTHKVPIVEVPIETIYIDKNQTSHFNPVKDSFKIYMVFGRFLFSSFSSSLVDLVFFSLFCDLFKDGRWGGLGYIAVATAAARVLSALYNYIINLRIVFRSSKTVRSTVWKYILLAAVQMVCSALLVSGLYPLTGGAEALVKIPVDMGLFFISFIIQREFVYS